MLFSVHDPHCPPPVPHAVVAVPATQKPVVPPSVTSQHPPLQGWLPVVVHVVTHVFVATSHAWFGRQSAAVAHPHWSPAPPSAEDRHSAPFAVVHTAHIPPGPPHVLVEPSEPAHVGAAGFVFASQHVPLQAWLLEQLDVHWLVAVSQAMPVGQSLVWVQPHLSPAPPSARPRHTAPKEPVPHTAHTRPGVPHVTPLASLPAHVGAAGFVCSSQHVPLQGVLDPQAVEHVFVTRLHAVPEGQSAALLHPQPLLTQVWPAELFVQLRHAAPAAPQDVACVSVAQKPVVPPSA
jgi:hypothetical protein